MNDIALQQLIASEALAELPPKYREFVTLERVKNAVECSTAAMPTKALLSAMRETALIKRVPVSEIRANVERQALASAKAREERLGGFFTGWLLSWFARRAIAFVLNWLIRRAITKLWQRYYPGDPDDESPSRPDAHSWDGSTNLLGDRRDA